MKRKQDRSSEVCSPTEGSSTSFFAQNCFFLCIEASGYAKVTYLKIHGGHSFHQVGRVHGLKISGGLSSSKVEGRGETCAGERHEES